MPELCYRGFLKQTHSLFSRISLKRLRLYSLVTLVSFLTACGFQLRGNIALAAGIEPLYIDESKGQLAIELRDQLTSSGIILSSDIHQANSRLIIRNSKSYKRSTALGEGARVIEYQLIESLFFELHDKSGKSLYTSGKLAERKIMENDPNKVASSSAEEKLLRREMLQNLAASISRQLSTVRLSATDTTPGI